MSQKPDKKHEVETTGHNWDGIEEYNNPLPRWWLWTFFACIIWALGYSIAYPAWPLIHSATAGVLGFSTRGEVAKEIARVQSANAENMTQLATVELVKLGDNPDLEAYAEKAGAAIFRTNCAQCHGSGAAGVKAAGYPNLLDDDWLWGGTIDNIHTTIAHGIRNEVDEDARYSQMPAFGEILEKEEIVQVANFVMSLSGQPNDPSMVEAGTVVFEDNCAACHSDDGTGDRSVGAPNLTDAIWLYGGSYDKIVETVTNSRFGVMPAWNQRLSEAEIVAVASYVHGLGGGEASE